MRSWLTSELQAAMSPPDVARFALDMSEDAVTLVERSGRASNPPLTARLGSERFEEEIALIRRRVGRSGRVDLLLPEALTLFRVDTFPGEARRNLREEAWWRLDALTPYAPEELCYDVAYLGADPNTGFIEVHIAVAPREIVNEAVAYAQDWGFTPRRVSSNQPAAGFQSGPEFLTVHDPASETRTLRKGAAALIAIALAFAAIGVTRGVFERQALVASATERRIDADETLAETLATREAALDLARRAITPTELRGARPLAVDLLAALARALPPETRIDLTLVTETGIRLEGVSENADAVLSAIALAPEFQNGRHAAPVREVAAQGRSAERFAIEAELADRGSDRAPAPEDAAGEATAAAEGAPQ